MGVEMREKTEKNRKFFGYMLAGLCLTGISALLFALLGEKSIFVSHDQLDGEVLCYMYRAKYLFTRTVIDEFMNGAGKNALTPPAPLFVLVYRILPAFPAFVVCQYVSMLAAFAGMYLWLTRQRIRPVAACVCGLLFAYLPLLPVYGFSMYGIPMLCWAMESLCEEKQGGGKKLWAAGRRTWLCLLVPFFYGAGSSLVLVGFAVLGAAFLYGLCRKKARKSSGYWLGFGILLAVYAVCNSSLILQVLGIGGGYITHKEEMQIQGLPFLQTFRETFLYGTEHSASYQKWIVLLLLAILLTGVFWKKLRNDVYKKLVAASSLALGIALFCALYSWEPVVQVRQRLGGAAVWLQLSRVNWLYPALWYTILGLCLQWLSDADAALRQKGSSGKAFANQAGHAAVIVSHAAAVAVCVATALSLLSAGVWKANVKQLLGKPEAGISWQDFYAEDVYGQVGEYLYQQTGETPDQYRVASLGICPAAALYNGFYCLDGYSNNYPLEYKQSFRKIIAPELEKNSYIKEYFDGWGNRCYLFSAQIPGYFTVQKGGFYFSGYEMDTEAFRQLGGRYVFSAAYIEGADTQGLTLLREEPFETENSYYRIYIYEAQ